MIAAGRVANLVLNGSAYRLADLVPLHTVCFECPQQTRGQRLQCMLAVPSSVRYQPEKILAPVNFYQDIFVIVQFVLNFTSVEAGKNSKTIQSVAHRNARWKQHVRSSEPRWNPAWDNSSIWTERLHL